MALAGDGRRAVTLLGSTGSVGGNTVDLLLRHRDRFSVAALVANRNHRLLAQQAIALRPELVVVADEAALAPLSDALAGTGIAVAAGTRAVIEAASLPSDCVIAAIVGAAGLAATLAAARRGAVLGLANKEALVCAGGLLMAEAAGSGAVIVPVDSEHSAIFQVFDYTQRERVTRVVLTASGGPFRTFTRDQMADVTPNQAIAHPNWKMGAKISVDSATMMNKGLEIIEAHHLFGLPEDRIDVLVHPQSVVHGMVEYADGSVLAQLGAPDMRMPISLALGWPRRLDAGGTRLDLAQMAQLSFEAPDLLRFPALRLAREALRAGGAATNVCNAANEVAVQAFLDGAIGFLEIAEVVEETLSRLGGGTIASLDDVLAWDARARRLSGDIIALSVG